MSADLSRLADHLRATGGAVKPDECSTCAEACDLIPAAIEQLDAIRKLIAHARLVSPSERAVIYVADLERALGIDAPTPHKIGQNG